MKQKTEKKRENIWGKKTDYKMNKETKQKRTI